MKIELITGPMFSGKTTELLRRGKRYERSGFKCLYVKHSNDIRYSSVEIVSHDKLSMSCITINSIKDLNGLEYDVLLIDEAQFIEDLDLIKNLRCKVVIVAGLCSNFNMEPFTNITNLVSVCDKIDMLTSICSLCPLGSGTEASFNKLMIDKPLDGNTTIIGNSNIYKAVCRECYYK